jgi:hypothetical protein
MNLPAIASAILMMCAGPAFSSGFKRASVSTPVRASLEFILAWA